MAFYVPEYLDIVDESSYLQAIQEVQFENPKLKKIEDLIGALREEYAISQRTRINADPKVKEISSLFEDIFGFYSFQFTVDQNHFPNAYTFPISSKIDAWNYKTCVKKTNEGIKFTPSARVNTVAVITTALLFDDNYTNRELVAILLHEIGHNFSDSINNTLGIFSNFKKILFIPALFTNPVAVSNNIRQVATKYNNYMRKNHANLVSAYNALQLFIGSVNYVVISVNRGLSTIPNFALSNLYNTINNIIQTAIRNPAGIIMKVVFSFFGKEDEYTSDSFVAMYGYGADLSSALLKLERHNATPVDEVFKDSEFGAMWFAFFVESVDMINVLFNNTHPPTAKRLLNILDTLEQEYSKDYINPKLKKETKKEIDEIRKLINDEMHNNSFDGNKWRVEWNKHIFASKADKTPKDKMIGEILDKIEEIEEE